MIDPRNVHFIATKHILRYLKGTVNYGLKYEASQKINLEGYVDSDWAGVEAHKFAGNNSKGFSPVNVPN